MALGNLSEYPIESSCSFDQTRKQTKNYEVKHKKELECSSLKQVFHNYLYLYDWCTFSSSEVSRISTVTIIEFLKRIQYNNFYYIEGKTKFDNSARVFQTISNSFILNGTNEYSWNITLEVEKQFFPKDKGAFFGKKKMK